MPKYTSYHLLFLIVLVSLLSFKPREQTRYYSVELFGSVVGEIKIVEKLLDAKKVEYSFYSEAEAELFFIKTKTKAHTKLIYESGFLNSGYVLRKKNDDVQELTYQWNEGKYEIVNNGKKSTESKKISYCSANFFFSEPIGIKEVYIERFNYFVAIQDLGNHQYLTKVDGGTNLYTYKNGVLVSLKSKKGVSVFMRLKE